MRIKRNGFTLVELLAVITILGMLTVMAVPSLMNLFSEKKDKLYNATISELERFASVYLTENPSLYTTIDEDGHVDITVTMLCNEKFLTCPVTDARDSSEITGYVRVTNERNDYIYEFVRENQPGGGR